MKKIRTQRKSLLFFALFIGHSIFAQKLDSQQKDFLLKNSQIIYKDSILKEANWAKVLEKVKDKRIVLLGELNHGSKENFLVRNELIKFLHQKGDFRLILFEAGLGEAYVVNRYKAQLDPQVMTYNFMGQWQNHEFKELMVYIKEQNLNMGGFDIQRGFAGFFEKLLFQECEKENLDSSLFKKLETNFLGLKRKLTNRKSRIVDFEDEAEICLSSYHKIHHHLNLKTGDSLSEDRLFVLKTIENRLEYIEYMLSFKKDNNWTKRWAARDSAMANNLKWLIEVIYPQEKVLVIGHNYHISNYNSEEAVMAEFLKEIYGDQMYSIGFFLGKGKYAQGGEKTLSAADSTSLDIKHIINIQKGLVNFLPTANQNEKGGDWLHENIIVNDSFIDLKSSNQLILAKSFDAIICIQHSSIPSFYE